MTNLGLEIGLGAFALLVLVGVATTVMNRKPEVPEPELQRPNSVYEPDSDYFNTPTDSKNKAFRTSTEQRDFENVNASRVAADNAAQERNDELYRKLFGTPRKDGGKRKSNRKSKRKSKRKL